MVAPIQRPKAEVGFGKDEAKIWELHQPLCEFVKGIC